MKASKNYLNMNTDLNPTKFLLVGTTVTNFTYKALIQGLDRYSCI